MFNEPRFTDETEARKYLESLRWPDGPVCAHCGSDARGARPRRLPESETPGCP